MYLLLRKDFLNHRHVVQKSTDIQTKTLHVKADQVPLVYQSCNGPSFCHHNMLYKMKKKCHPARTWRQILLLSASKFE